MTTGATLERLAYILLTKLEAVGVSDTSAFAQYQTWLYVCLERLAPDKPFTSVKDLSADEKLSQDATILSAPVEVPERTHRGPRDKGQGSPVNPAAPIKQMLLQVLKDNAGRPMDARDVWQEAQNRGARTSIENPAEALHSARIALGKLVRRGDVEKVGDGQWRYKLVAAVEPETLAETFENDGSCKHYYVMSPRLMGCLWAAASTVARRPRASRTMESTPLRKVRHDRCRTRRARAAAGEGRRRRT